MKNLSTTEVQMKGAWSDQQIAGMPMMIFLGLATCVLFSGWNGSLPLGMVGALELVPSKPSRSYFPDRGRVGQLCRDFALRNGLILRATNDAMLLSPPLVISRDQVDELAEKAWKALDLTARELGMATG
mgnify:CR=1 FL=1